MVSESAYVNEIGNVSDRDLAKALKKIFRYTSNEGIEKKVSDKSIKQSHVRVIEQSDFWQEHAKMHKGAKLHVLDAPKVNDSNIRNTLSIDKIDYSVSAQSDVSYSSQETTKAGEYGAAHSKRISSKSGQTYVAATADPKNKEFWMGCTCGMTVKAEEHQGNEIQLKSYDVANTGESLGYAVSTGSVRYNASQGEVTYSSNMQEARYS